MSKHYEAIQAQKEAAKNLPENLREAVLRSIRHDMVVEVAVEDLDAAQSDLNMISDNVETGYEDTAEERDVVGWNDDSDCESSDWSLRLIKA